MILAIFERRHIFRFLFGRDRRAAGIVARRWRNAFTREPALAADLIALSNMLSLRGIQIADDQSLAYEKADPLDVMYEKGRRDMAMALLALGGVSQYELNQLLMEGPDA